MRRFVNYSGAQQESQEDGALETSETINKAQQQEWYKRHNVRAFSREAVRLPPDSTAAPAHALMITPVSVDLSGSPAFSSGTETKRKTGSA